MKRLRDFIHSHAHSTYRNETFCDLLMTCCVAVITGTYPSTYASKGNPALILNTSRNTIVYINQVYVWFVSFFNVTTNKIANIHYLKTKNVKLNSWMSRVESIQKRWKGRNIKRSNLMVWVVYGECLTLLEWQNTVTTSEYPVVLS